jgi:type IV pilus assembly protein PilC
MPLYAYQALTRDGKKKSGQLDAGSTAAVRELLFAQGLYAKKIELASLAKSSSFHLADLFKRPVGLKEKIFFSKQLAVLLKSGIPLLPALELLAEQTDGQLKDIVIDLKDMIKEGDSLADGLQKYPKTFDSIYVQLVRAGEASGKLETILEGLTRYLVRQAEVRKRISKATTQPMINLGFIFCITGYLLIKVIPQLTESLKSMGGELPSITKVTIALSDFLKNYYILIGLSLFALIGIFKLWTTTASGKKTVDGVKLKIPFISYFTRTGAIIQFCRTLGILLQAGVNISEALFIVTKIVDNSILSNALIKARDNIIKQGKIAEYLRQTNIFPATAIYLINTGEQSGHLDNMLLSVAENYEEELNDYVDSLTNKIGPATLILTMIIVLPILLSVLLPIVEATGNMSDT